MAEFFRMPQASPTMEAGTLLSWKLAEGAAFKSGAVIAEVETDKAAMEVEIFDVGVVLKILAPAGEVVKAGHPIAIVGKAGEDISGLLAEYAALSSAPRAASPAPVPAPAPAPLAAPAPAPVAAPATPAPEKVRGGLTPPSWMGQPLNVGFAELPIFTLEEEEARVRAAPAARKAAAELGVDLGRVSGSGPRGRVLRSDVEKAAQPAAAPAPSAAAGEQHRNSNMRRTIARRLKEVWQDAPVFYLTSRYNCDQLVVFREQLKAAGLSASYNDILIKACARALKDVPAVNASWGEEAITRHGAVHIGVAVALPDGLITPVVRNADQKGLAAISAEVRELAGRAKERKLKPDEYTGSTFSISNLGMMGIEHFTAILNPPEAVILAVGAMQREPVVKEDGSLGVGWRMKVTLTCDHRVVDGALGAEFLQALRRYVESPALLAS